MKTETVWSKRRLRHYGVARQSGGRTRMPAKLLITEAALFARCNRILAQSGQRLWRARGKLQIDQVGRFYVASDKGVVIHERLDLEAFARSIGAIKAHEKLA